MKRHDLEPFFNKPVAVQLRTMPFVIVPEKGPDGKIREECLEDDDGNDVRFAYPIMGVSEGRPVPVPVLSGSISMAPEATELVIMETKSLDGSATLTVGFPAADIAALTVILLPDGGTADEGPPRIVLS